VDESVSHQVGSDLVDGLDALAVHIVKTVLEKKVIRSESRAYYTRKNHMEDIDDMFLCPQGGTLYTDNTKVRGYLLYRLV
jgi:hypothetical protein